MTSRAPSYALDDVLGHDRAVDRINSLLTKAGFPLEVQVGAICRSFAKNVRRRLVQRGFPSAQRLVYGVLDKDEPLRELDQLVRFYDEVTFADELYGLCVGTSVAIECKRREGIAFFGVRRLPDEDGGGPPSCIPLESDLVGSELVATALEPDPDFLSSTAYSDIVGVKFKDAKVPVDVDKEQLVYKASAGLFDYFSSSWGGFMVDHDLELLKGSGILGDVGIDHEHTFFLDWREWLERLQPEHYEKFNALVFPGDGVPMSSAEHAVAVVCTDSPLYEASMQEAGDLGPPSPVKWLRTSGRYSARIHTSSELLAHRTPEFDSFIVHKDHLTEFLEGIQSWQQKRLRLLNEVSDELARRAPLEAALCLLVRRTRGADRGVYTSEFGSPID